MIYYDYELFGGCFRIHAGSPVTVPGSAVDFVAPQLVIVDGSDLGSYAERSKTPYEHRWEIAQANGCRRLSAPETTAEFKSILTARAWTPDGASNPTLRSGRGMALCGVGSIAGCERVGPGSSLRSGRARRPVVLGVGGAGACEAWSWS
ncbi:DUF4158 domain-containing protein [Arthrobacter sp. H20]|uniref:DUF4158 domain-containing protein n=1 Tax=Arthrobacter sp. H20 TaxID=1267981 RepID=UPI0009DCF092|nr:DUF4158 domain-containing protein [Arthrobacter sp. H20]